MPVVGNHDYQTVERLYGARKPPLVLDIQMVIRLIQKKHIVKVGVD
ncbi:MAG: hypothetical protein ACD_61C00232G0002 [uncultured bacterium]|nr:MAG: hypothetical protein ACD_61C00232G0002 [uncultured bacterium]